MNSRLLAAFLCLCTVSTGCIYVDNGGGGLGGGGSVGGGGSGGGTTTPPSQQSSGDITFLWTFSSQGAGRCADVPNVKSIRVTIPGETLLNGGIYACNTETVDGIVLHDFAGGSYKYTLEAVDYSGKVVYSASGSVNVNGDTTVKVDLAPGSSTGGGTGGSNSSFSYASWTFEPTTASANPTCTQANVTNVDVRIDGGAWTRFGCEDGFGGKQVSLPYVAPGQHTVDLVGLNVTSAASTVAFYKSGSVTTASGSPVSSSFTLGAVGGLALRWQFINGSLSKTCAEAGVSSVSVNLTDSTGAFVYGDAGRNQACTDVGFSDAYLKPGKYTVYIRGFDSGKTLIYTNENNSPPTLTVTAAQQPAAKDGTTIYLQPKK